MSKSTGGFVAALAIVWLSTLGCRTAARHSGTMQDREMEMGPPPYGYIKILGEPVPDWKPSDMRFGPRNAGIGLDWQPIGPRPILDEFWSGDDDASGRVVSIAPHPTDPNIVYIASASGGIWKTTDGGALWVPLTDELSILNHGCVALDPSNPETVYAGTGEYTTGSNGDGLFRSTDGGMTWDRIATTSQVGSRCSRVVIDPGDPLIIHVTGDAGYARSTDGGTTWSRRLSGSASDLAINPDDPSVVYVAMRSDGIYRSTNGGSTFSKLASGLPTFNIRRILIAVARSNPGTMYAAFINPGNGLEGAYKSIDSGDNWVELTNTPDFPSPQGWYDAFLGVDPTDENLVFAGGVFPTYAVAGVIRSFDGGNNWTDVTIGAAGGQLHPDQQTIAFGPTGTIWVGNDGGVWRTDNLGASWINVNATLTVTQNYNVAVHPLNPNEVIGGTQDNGSIGRTLAGDQWPQIIGGDGGFLAFDQDDPLQRYVTYVHLTVYRFYGSSYSANITGPWETEGDPSNFIAPLVMDPNDSHTLLGGTNRIWRTHNAHAAADWTPISDTTVSAGGKINAIAVAAGASDTIYTGSSNGRVYVTQDAATWNNRWNSLPSGPISDIVIDPSDPGIAYVAYYNTSGKRIARTENYGVSWNNMTGSLPSGVAARALAVDWRFAPPAMCIGSGSGVYCSFDGGTGWMKDGLELPNVNVGDLVIDPVSSTITVGTYGRGTWQATMADCNLNQSFDGFDIANGTSADCNANSVPDECDITGGTSPDTNGNGAPDECEPPLLPAYPHDQPKNRYVSFDTNPGNRGVAVSFQVELRSMDLASCDGNGGRCRLDRGDADCKACSGQGTPCVSAAIDCSAGETCDPTGDTCVADFYGSVGQTWWVGPPDTNDVAHLVSEPNRYVSDVWPATIHLGDCEIVPRASYGIRAVSVERGTSDELVVDTTPKPGSNYWADGVGPFRQFCGGDPLGIRCTGPDDPICPTDQPCTGVWTAPDGTVNFDDVGAAVRVIAPLPGAVLPDITWVDIHGNVNGDAALDPPNFVANFSDIQFMVLAFQGRDYPFVDPSQCPDLP